MLISNIFIHLTPFPWFLATNNQSFLSLLKSFIYSIYAKPTYCQNIPLKLQMLLQTNIITPPSIYLTLKPSWVSKSSYQTNCNLKKMNYCSISFHLSICFHLSILSLTFLPSFDQQLMIFLPYPLNQNITWNPY